MENGNKRKWQIRGAVAAIFLLGFLAGALALNFYHSRRSSFRREARSVRYEQMLSQLNLTTEQRTQVEQIMKDSRSQIRSQMIENRKQSEPRFAEIRKQTDERLQAVLTPQQWQQWQQMTSEMRGRRGRERRQ